MCMLHLPFSPLFLIDRQKLTKHLQRAVGAVKWGAKPQERKLGEHSLYSGQHFGSTNKKMAKAKARSIPESNWDLRNAQFLTAHEGTVEGVRIRRDDPYTNGPIATFFS